MAVERRSLRGMIISSVAVNEEVENVIVFKLDACESEMRKKTKLCGHNETLDWCLCRCRSGWN